MSSSSQQASSHRGQLPRSWPFNVASYIPHLETGIIVQHDLETFENAFLSIETAVRLVRLKASSGLIDDILDAKQLESHLEIANDENDRSSRSDFFFINRYLVKGGSTLPNDSNKLRLSKHAFELLRLKFGISPSFISSLSNIHKPLERALPSPISGGSVFNFWMILPIRVQVPCENKKKSHISGNAGRSQMNPLHYLHLSQPSVDIRGSHIAVYFVWNPHTKASSSIVFNFQNGRWWRIVEEPISRIKEALGSAIRNGFGHDPFYIQGVFLTSALRWWNNALNSFNDQLIAYEENLLVERQPLDEEAFQLNSETNRALHCMAAHLHRYGSELALITGIVDDLKKYNQDYHQDLVDAGLRPAQGLAAVSQGIERIASHLSTIRAFRDELQLKTDNTLALLVDKTQAMNDLLLVQNSKSMQEILHATQAEAELSRQIASQSQHVAEQMHRILQATQEEAKMSRRVAIQSQRLSEEMKKDSVAMKTIALLTTFFLPGTSFAAILAMPFFTDSAWFQSTDKFWLWVVLTVPSTTFCFLFYIIWNRSVNKRKQAEIGDEELAEMEPCAPPS